MLSLGLTTNLCLLWFGILGPVQGRGGGTFTAITTTAINSSCNPCPQRAPKAPGNHEEQQAKWSPEGVLIVEAPVVFIRQLVIIGRST